MRYWIWPVAMSLGLAITSSMPAQGTGRFLTTGQRVSTFGGGARNIINQPIDTSNLVAPIPGQPRSNSLLDFFRNLSFPTFPALFGSSDLPAPSSLPNAFQPLPPQIPGQ